MLRVIPLGGLGEIGLNMMVVEYFDYIFVIDAGLMFPEEYMPGVDVVIPDFHYLRENLEKVRAIIFTHGHIDHVSGTCDSQGRPIFPNARYIITESEWKYIKTGSGTNERQNFYFEYARKYLLPLADRFDIVADNAEVLPGIKFVPAPGHTPGNIMLDISSGEERLLCIGDIIHSYHELVQSDYAALFDVTPEQAISTRAQILSDVAESGVLVFACHFTFPGIGYIKQKDGAFAWQPI